MNFLELVQSRQSTRAYDMNKPVESEKLNRILECAHLSPSASNAQPWHFIVVTEPELKNKISDATALRILGMNHFTKQAPVHIVVVQESVNLESKVGSLIKKHDYAEMDLGIATAHLVLAARAEGLDTCIMGWFNEKKIKGLLNIPRSKRARLVITLGYSTQPLRNKIRKPFEEVISFNSYK
jgi:nitroreductase